MDLILTIVICLLVAVLAVLITAGIIAFSIAFSRVPLKIGLFSRGDTSPQQWHELRNDIDNAIEKLKNTHCEQWYMTSFDGLKLSASFIPVENAKRTILCVHGYRSSGYFDFCLAVGHFLDNDCNLLIIDHRAHGRSEGKYITYGLKERYDVRDWTNVIRERLGDEMPIYLDGVSMGCATVLMASALDLNPCVKGIIADCGYTSCYDIIKKVCTADMHIPYFPVIPILNLFFKIRTGYFMNEVRVYDEVKKTRLPVVFAHGKADEFVPCEMTLKNYDACNSKKWLLISEGAQHGMSYVKSPEVYKKYISELFEVCE